MKLPKSWIIRILLTVLIIGIAYYIYLPPIHVMSIPFWFFLICCALLVAFICFSTSRRIEKTIHLPHMEKTVVFRSPGKAFLSIIVGIAVLVVLLMAIGFVGSTPIFHADKYAQLIEKETGNFSEDVAEIPWNRIPTVDHSTAERLGNRKMGEVVELVSQFNVSNEYTQINFVGDPVRVTPLNYASLIKWFTNQSEGIPYYMSVNMIDGATDLIQMDDGIRYSKSEHLNRNLHRHLRFQFPFKIFYNSNFEVDETGRPVWVTPVYRMQVGLFGGPDVTEVIITDAVSGDSELMSVNDVPNWVDRVYDASLVINQINFNGKFQSGFINSIIGQKGVLAATEGYNYLALRDDVYLYTGITSVSADESNIGFVLVNMRTKDCQFYPVPSAEEFSAMDSAQGAVQEKRYNATFPLLINMNNRPTYFLSLKDEAGLIKMYAFIDAQNYQHVVTGSTVEEAYKNFASQAGVVLEEGFDESQLETIDGTIADVQPVVMEGNTVYYFTVSGDDNIYMAQISVSERLPFMKNGDDIRMEYLPAGEGVRRVVNVLTDEAEGGENEQENDEQVVDSGSETER